MGFQAMRRRCLRDRWAWRSALLWCMPNEGTQAAMVSSARNDRWRQTLALNEVASALGSGLIPSRQAAILNQSSIKASTQMQMKRVTKVMPLAELPKRY
ncbi:MAG: hypothetical protein DMG68_17790 [Acidobacteria bacterium]|nr:MAG: hypothetical protein DMG68_17790 [Acidobacteriota bacterium]